MEYLKEIIYQILYLNEQSRLFLLELLIISILGFSFQISFRFLNFEWVKSSYQILNFLLLAPIGFAITSVISSNIALSLGMVGALSIIRFRSAIKDPIDIVYMFWAVSAGISNGIFNFKVAFLSSIFISIVVMVLKDIPQRGHTYMFVCKFSQEFESQVMSVISES